MTPVPKDEIPDLLAAADAAIITLKNADTFAYGISPNKLFEYMAAARPVICSVPGDMARLVKDAKAGISCAPEDPRALSLAVRQLHAMPQGDRADLGQQGRHHILQYYRREALVELLASTLSQLGCQGAKVHRSSNNPETSAIVPAHDGEDLAA